MIFEMIQSLSETNKINLTKLERECGLANATIRRWKSRSPNVDSLVKVADYFDVSLDFLVGRNKYSLSDGARKCALQYDDLPNDKKELLRCYISVLKVE